MRNKFPHAVIYIFLIIFIYACGPNAELDLQVLTSTPKETQADNIILGYWSAIEENGLNVALLIDMTCFTYIMLPPSLCRYELLDNNRIILIFDDKDSEIYAYSINGRYLTMTQTLGNYQSFDLIRNLTDVVK